MTKPRVIVINSSAVDIYWFRPTSPNGLISTYRVYRSSDDVDSVLIYKGSSHIYGTVDGTVEAGTQYDYSLEAETAGGATNSSWVPVTLPESTPSSVPNITNITALSSESIFVAWDRLTNSSMVQYSVLINGSSPGDKFERPLANSTSTSHNITGLRPYTWYSARMVACIRNVSNSCGTGPVSERVRTLEAPPVGQRPPLLTSTGPTTVTLSWKPPVRPNGVIFRQRIRRRERVESNSSLSESGVLVDVVNGSVHTYTDDGRGLRSFTVYEYSITAVNSQGEVNSDWTEVRTLEAAPEDMLPPVVSPVGRYTFFVSWQPPTKPNGEILRYELEYRAEDGGVNMLHVSVTNLNTSVSGVQPYTNHSVRVGAVNSVGSAVSDWTSFITLSASPSGVSAVSVELVLGGRSAILSWSPPTRPNGGSLNYTLYNGSVAPIYSGVNRQFELLDLEPYTEHSVQLESCTDAGCTRSPWQRFTTLQAPPTNQQTPSVDFFNESSILIAWSRPAKTFGDILTYQLLRRTLSVVAPASSRTKRSPVEYEIIYTTVDTSASYYTYVDITVLPFTR